MLFHFRFCKHSATKREKSIVRRKQTSNVDDVNGESLQQMTLAISNIHTVKAKLLTIANIFSLRAFYNNGR